MVRRLKQRIFNLITRSSVTASTTALRGATLGIQGVEGEDRDGAEYFEPFGLAGAVPVGSEGIALDVGGTNDQIVVVCASPKGSTPEGRQIGEVDLYAAYGQRIRLHADGSISLLQGSTGTVYVGTDVNPAAPLANRSGDPVIPSAELIAWMTAASALLNIPTGTFPLPIPTTVGSTQATTTTTRIG